MKFIYHGATKITRLITLEDGGVYDLPEIYEHIAGLEVIQPKREQVSKLIPKTTKTKSKIIEEVKNDTSN